MRNVKGYLVAIIYIIIGAVLLGCGVAGIVDEFWTGMGSAFLMLGIIQLVKSYRFNKNDEYREKVETENNDERNRFIRNKAWAWAGYLFVMIMAVASIILKIAGQDLLSIFASGMVCLVIVLFWVSYFILRRKY